MPITRVATAADGRGEVAVYDERGRAVRIYSGFGNPDSLVPAENGGFYVADRAAGQILQVNEAGEVVWSAGKSGCIAALTQMTVLPNGNLLLVCEVGTVLELDRSGATVWRAQFRPQEGIITSAIRLEDGATLVVYRARGNFVFLIPRDGSDAIPLEVNVGEPHQNTPRGAGVPGRQNQFLLWDTDWSKTYRCRLEGRRVVVEETLSLARLATGFVASSDELTYTRLGLEACSWRRGHDQTCWSTVYWPNSVVPTEQSGHYFVSYRRVEDKSWPEVWLQTLPAEPTIDWKRFWLWLIGAVALTSLLRLLSWAALRQTNTGGSATASVTRGDARTAATPRETRDVSADLRPRRQWVAWAVTVGGALAGGACAVHGQGLLLQGVRRDGLLFLVAGAIAAGGCLELWRRWGLREGDRYWASTLEARPDLRDWPIVSATLLIVAIGCVLLYDWRSHHTAYADQVGLWVGLIILLLGVSLRRSRDPAPGQRPWDAWDGVYLTLALLVGLVTIGYRLRDIPTNIHFDFVFYALKAQEVLEGRVRDIWSNGFVPVPVMGLIPEWIGLGLVGMGELGIRLGAALYGLSGLIAIYILGRTYRDSETGLLAALFLAGNRAYMHFSRIPSNGESATTALWTITTFALALRYGSPRLWILTGLAGGYTFYLYPVGRPALVACAVFGVLVTLRSPRLVLRRWFGPLIVLLVLAVILVPLIPSWIRNPALVFPRVQESVTVFKPQEGLNWDALRASFGEPFLRSLGWFFVETDRSSQGSLSPGLNMVEAALLAIGFGVAIFEGLSLNVLFLGFVCLVLVTCGAWAVQPPWYTRLLPTAPVAALLIARAVMGYFSLLPISSPLLRCVLFAPVVVGVIVCSPAANVRLYFAHETGQSGFYNLGEMTAIGRRMRELGPAYQYYLVITKNSVWTVDPAGGSRFGELIPYMWDKRVREVRDLQAVLPFPKDEKAAVFLQADRIEEDAGILRQWYPDVKVETIVAPQGQRRAGLVVIN